MKHITDFIIRFRIPILLIVVIITAFFGFQLKDLRMDNSVEGMLPDEDPAKQFFEEFQEIFGSDEVFIVALETDTVFDPEFLEVVDELTQRLEKIENIDEVISLTNVDEIRGSEGLLEVGPLMETLPRTDNEIEAFRKAVFDNPLHINYLVTEQENLTALYGMLSSEDLPQTITDAMTAEVRAAVDELVPDDVPVYIAGVPVVKNDMGKFLKRDQMIFIPVTFLLMAMILYGIFRSIHFTIIPLVMVCISVTWTMGLVSLMDRPVTVVLAMLTPLVIVMTTAHTIHIFSHYQENNLTISDKITSLKTTTNHMLLPCLLTTITTAIGFSSLSVSNISAVRDFGIFTAIGVIFSFIVVLSVVPNILYFIPRSKMRARIKAKPGVIERLLGWLSVFVQHNKRLVVITSIVLCIIAIIGITRITVETDVINYFRKKSDIYRSTFFISHNLTGTGSLNVYIGGSEEDAIKNPEVLREMERLQQYLESQEHVTKTISLVDFLKDMNLAMHDENREYYVIPESRELVAQYLLLYSMSGDPDDFERFVDFYYQNGTVLARTTPMSSKVLLAFVDDVILFCEDNFSDDLDIRVTGTSVLYDNMSSLLVKSQIRSILLALVMIFIVMSLVFRSVYIGGLSMIPNVIPIFLTLGLMGWLMIDLDTSTTMISSVAIGIAIDDTVHFITRYFREIADGRNVEHAIENTMLNTGRPIMFTSLVIGSGFVVLLAASFIPTRSFGILTAFTMFSALVADLFVLPVVLMAVRPTFKGWKGFALDK